MGSALISGLSSPSSSPGKGNCIVFIMQDIPLHPGICTSKWIPANLMLGEPSDVLASHPGGSRNTPSRLMLQKPG